MSGRPKDDPSKFTPDNTATLAAAAAACSPHDKANTYCTSDPEHPLERYVHVSTDGCLDDFASRRSGTITWAPSQSALQRIFQQTKFLDLGGQAERVGDLKSIVLHDVTLESATSTFPTDVGVNIAGVDRNTFTYTGEAFSHVVPGNSQTNMPKVLQSDDVGAAYEFARTFPGAAV